jgi:adenosylcobinamide kinase/adenosylcobinamide-phosphate guanylyltransferase
MKTLVLGGARSGKSRLAESLAMRSEKPVVYVATAQAGDAEMQKRIDAHRARRPSNWSIVEEPLHLTKALESIADDRVFVVVDCLTLWITNLLILGDDERLRRERDALIATLVTLKNEVVLVGNETGMGITPLGELTRRFVDESGWLNQQLAQTCERVVLTIAGLPSVLKGKPL